MDSVTGVAEEVLKRMGACTAGRVWARGKTLRQAWKECTRGDWLLWLAARVGVDQQLLVIAACDCARLALGYVPLDEERPRAAIEKAHAWADGTKYVTLSQVRSAANDAETASLFAPYGASLASAAAMQAASAARAAAFSALESAAAYQAAHTAALAAEIPYGTTGWAHTQATAAALVRTHIPWATVRQTLLEGEAW